MPAVATGVLGTQEVSGAIEHRASRHARWLNIQFRLSGLSYWQLSQIVYSFLRVRNGSQIVDMIDLTPLHTRRQLHVGYIYKALQTNTVLIRKGVALVSPLALDPFQVDNIA